MSQLIFKFPFKIKYYEQDFYVSNNNFSAYRLIESWPNWSGKWLNVFGASGSGKTHLSKILEKKIEKVQILDAKKVNENLVSDLDILDCLIIDNFNNNIDEKLFYSILNQSRLLEKYVVINSLQPIKKFKFNLEDLQSRINSFVFMGIELPTDELLQVIISKAFSERQIDINPKISDYIINNVDRSYEKMFKFLKDIDELSLSTGKSININLIKKVLNQ
jgi:chromosomal replication initiation ATPase DnaA